MPRGPTMTNIHTKLSEANCMPETQSDTHIIARDSIYAIARISDRNSVWTSVCHTGGLYKNG